MRYLRPLIVVVAVLLSLVSPLALQAKADGPYTVVFFLRDNKNPLEGFAPNFAVTVFVHTGKLLVWDNEAEKEYNSGEVQFQSQAVWLEDLSVETSRGVITFVSTRGFSYTSDTTAHGDILPGHVTTHVYNPYEAAKYYRRMPTTPGGNVLHVEVADKALTITGEFAISGTEYTRFALEPMQEEHVVVGEAQYRISYFVVEDEDGDTTEFVGVLMEWDEFFRVYSDEAARGYMYSATSRLAVTIPVFDGKAAFSISTVGN